MTELPEGIAKGVYVAADSAMNDWTEEQVLDEIVALTELVEMEDDANRTIDGMSPFALSHISERLGRLYQEVGKKLL